MLTEREVEIQQLAAAGFVFEVPRSASPQTARRLQPGRPTVLVREHYRVLQADSAPGALEVSNTFAGVINLLIADHTLKTMTGRQVAERLCQSRPDLKVLYISGYPIGQLIGRGEAIAGANFLAKPFLPNALVEKVREILSRAIGARSA